MAAQSKNYLNLQHYYTSNSTLCLIPIRSPCVYGRATRSAMKSNDDEVIPPPIKVQDVKVARGLASEITQSGAKLYDLLANESTERFLRHLMCDLIIKRHYIGLRECKRFGFWTSPELPQKDRENIRSSSEVLEKSLTSRNKLSKTSGSHVMYSNTPN